MSPFAMAGIAEAAVGAELAMLFLGIIVTGLIASFSFVFKPRALCGVALVLFGLLTFVLQPWNTFVLFTSDDWDARQLHDSYQQLCRYWGVLLVIISLASCFAFCIHEPRRNGLRPIPRFRRNDGCRPPFSVE